MRVLWPRKFIKINHSFNCDSKCLIYLFSYKVCGIHYVGSTVDRFRLRWNNYKSCQRKAADGRTPNQNYFYEYFLSAGHNGLRNGCEIIFIENTDSPDSTKREFFWMKVLKTIAPLGFNPHMHKTFLQLYCIKRVLGDPQKEMLN